MLVIKSTLKKNLGAIGQEVKRNVTQTPFLNVFFPRSHYEHVITKNLYSLPMSLLTLRQRFFKKNQLPYLPYPKGEYIGLATRRLPILAILKTETNSNSTLINTFLARLLWTIALAKLAQAKISPLTTYIEQACIILCTITMR